MAAAIKPRAEAACSGDNYFKRTPNDPNDPKLSAPSCLKKSLMNEEILC